MKKIILALLIGLASLSAYAANGTIPGAIRWDAYYGDGTETGNATVRRSLGAQQFQFRAPFFSVPTNNYNIVIDGRNQTTLDSEIAYAVTAGLKYWAFLYYRFAVDMDRAYTLYQSSANKNDIKWAKMIQPGEYASPSDFASNAIPMLTSDFATSNYLKVGGQPVLFMYNVPTAIVSGWGGSNSSFASSITALRSACATAGVGNPYILIMGASGSAAGTLTVAVGADGFTNYLAATGKGTTTQPVPYATMTGLIAAQWTSNASAAASSSVASIPNTNMGSDTRTRQMHVPSFETTSRNNYVSMLNYVVAPTAGQVTSHLGDLVTFLLANTATNPNKLCLIYAWNEHDEGGSMINPQYGSGTPDLTYTNAVGAVNW